MGVEIERKFLTRNDGWRACADEGVSISQGYLNEVGNTVRVRIAGKRAFLTVKGKTQGFSRLEFEYEVPLSDASAMMSLCQSPIVCKTRYRVPFEGHVWEVDVFGGDNDGLVVAECELGSEEEALSIPSWAGEEVTADKRYRNTHLASKPFNTWNKV